MPCLLHVLCRVCGMFCGLNWEDIVADGKWQFPGWFRVKMACNGAIKGLLGTLMRGSHTIVWLGSKLQPSGMQLRGFRRNCVALIYFQTSNFK